MANLAPTIKEPDAGKDAAQHIRQETPKVRHVGKSPSYRVANVSRR